MKQYLLVCAALLAVIGCQRRSFDGGESGDGSCTIRFQVENTMSVEPGSKVDITSVGLPSGSTIRVVAYQRKAADQSDPDFTKDTWKATSTYKVEDGGTLVPCHVNDDGTVNTTNTDPAKGMELHNGVYDFYAYAPARKLEADNKTVKGIGHYQDFLGTSSCSQTVNKSNPTVALTFEHENSKVTFAVRQIAGMTCDKLFADSVVLRTVGVPVLPSSGGYTIGGDIAATIGAATNTCIARKFTYIESDHQEKGASGSEITLPKSNGTIPTDFYITLNDTTYLLKATLPSMSFVKGHNYLFTMRVKQGSVDLTLQIVSWGHVVLDNPGMGDDNGSILIGSWGSVDWSGGMGGNIDPVTGVIQIGSWTPVDFSADLGFANGSGLIDGWGSGSVSGGLGDANGSGLVGGWDNVGQNNPGFGKE